MSGELEILAFGRPRLRKDGQPLAELVSAKAQALLVYLAVTGKTYSRSALAGLLWGDMPEETARANLRLTLTKLRKAVGGHLTITHEAVAFNPELPYQLDTAAFLVHAAQPHRTSLEQLRAALNLYQADFLEDFYIPEAPEFENWAAAERERLRQAAFGGWQYVAEQARARHDVAEGLTAARQVLALEPWREEAHRQLMEWLAESGQRSAALAQFEVCQHVLAEELSVAPSKATVALYEAIKARGQEAAEVRPTRLNASAPRNLPAPLTPFVGREAECAQVLEQLANPACRLLTLLGPGGIGKTRLALGAAERLNIFPDGVFFTTLTGQMPARLDEAVDELVTNIANALRYTFAAQQAPRELLLNYLADKTLLLILDNVEGWRPVGKFLAELLRRAPNVKLLLTSRERMGVLGEWLLAVKGLAFASTTTEYASATYPAFQLFVQGARRLRPEFDPAAEANAINRLCQLVEGSPLALELAARWVQTLNCAEIVARLEQGFDLLSADETSSAERHQSVRVVLVDSWRTLTEAERQAFRQLSVFRGGFHLLAAEQVAGATPAVLDGLINKSWLRLEGARYQMHELLRQYGAEQLAATLEEHTATHARHGGYYAEFLHARQATLASRLNADALAEVEGEIDNVRAALDWLLVHGQAELLVNGLSGFWSYAQRKGWYQEAAFILERTLRREATPNHQRARWYLWLGEAQYQLGRVAECEEHFAQALELLGQPLPKTQLAWGALLLRQGALQVQHRFWPPTPATYPLAQRQQWLDMANAFSHLGPLYYQTGDGLGTLTTAFCDLNLTERAGFIPERAQSYAGCCISLGSLPLHALAARYAELALNNARDAGRPSALAYVLEIVALYYSGLGRWAEVQAMLEESVALYAQQELYRSHIEALSLLAKAYYLRGEFQPAHRYHAEALHLSRQRGDFSGEHWSLLGLVDCALRLGEVEVGSISAWLKQAEVLQAKHPIGTADVLRFYGTSALIYFQQGQALQAQEAIQSALRLAQRNALAGLWTMEGFAGLAETSLRLWETAPAASEARALAATAQQACRTLQAFARPLPVAQPRTWLCEGWWAWLNGQRAQAQRHWQKSLSLAEQLAMPYERARAHYALGHYGQQPQHLQQAEALFEKLQCRAG